MWWWKNEMGIPQQFIRDVGAIVRPGDSSLFILLRTPDPLAALEQLRNCGDTLLFTSLSPEQDKKLTAVLASK